MSSIAAEQNPENLISHNIVKIEIEGIVEIRRREGKVFVNKREVGIKNGEESVLFCVNERKDDVGRKGFGGGGGGGGGERIRRNFLYSSSSSYSYSYSSSSL
ncbi:hypothetical protein Lal_00011605 [Lupinus albus]|nr:hypothetical protein Lal_00011605 [Lupinus albus]